MLDRTTEKQAHAIRWALIVGWFLIIFSLFYDPLTPWLTDPSNALSPIRLNPDVCVDVQGTCLPEQPYPIGARFFWAAIVPAGIFILFVFGHEFWRRICPLAFVSQMPRALGWQRQSAPTNAKARAGVVKVAKNSWLAKNHLFLQLGFFYSGLCVRLLFVNSDRLALGIFLLATIGASVYVGYLFGGKSWCQYFCPMAPVQKIYSEPRGLLNSRAHVGDRQKITQSMCRTIGQEGKEKPACVACQTPCIDIDAERSYWDSVSRVDHQWLYYTYFGLTIGFYVYFYLYSGGWDYYFSGSWTHEEGQLATLFNPGFYIAGRAIPIPKLFAVPLTLGAFGLSGYWLGSRLEKRLKAHFLRQGQPVSSEYVRHKMFSLCTFLIFNIFFMFGGRPNLSLFPLPVRYLFTITIAIASGAWLFRTWQRTPYLYKREELAGRLRKQLQKLKLDVARFLDGRSLEDLSADEVYVLAKILPDFSHGDRLQVYESVLKEAIEDGRVSPAKSLEEFGQLRQELSISDKEHGAILTTLGRKSPELFDSSRNRSPEQSLRLSSYREALIEAIMHAWKDRPGHLRVADLLQALSEKTSNEAVEEILSNLSQSAREVVREIREEYSITAIDETEALQKTDPEELWRTMANHVRLLEKLNSGIREASITVREARPVLVSWKPETLQKLFNCIDADRSGQIQITELQEYIRVIDLDMTAEQVVAMMQQADTNRDGQVSYAEFESVFKSLRA